MNTFLTRILAFAAEKLNPPTARQHRLALMYEPANLANSATAATVNGAIRAAEMGDTRALFSLYRDLVCGGSHVQAEFSKRKLAVLSQPHNILPIDAENPDDLAAAAAVKAMIEQCDNWTDGLTYLLDSALWPVSVVEKLYAPAGPSIGGGVVGDPPLRFRLRRLEPVNHTLLCFRQPSGAGPAIPAGGAVEAAWEPDLRFYATDAAGALNYSWEASLAADRARHLVHRGHLLVGIRDNWGGPMRSVLYWWFLSGLIREWWARTSERYGAPFPVGHTDASNQAAIDLLKDAFAAATKIGGLVVDHETQIELMESAITGAADNYERFHAVCNREISKVIVGQTLSGEAAPTGLGSGTSKLQGDVREDIRMFDQLKLGETLRTQLFAPFLDINGLSGRAPKIVWGGLSDTDAQLFGDLLEKLSRAGWEPTDDAIPVVQERVGFAVQRKAAPLAPAPGARPMDPEEAEGFSVRAYAAQALLADNLGVPAGWLNPLRDWFDSLTRLAADRRLTDTDMLRMAEAAARRLPELFGRMDIRGLARTLEAGMGQAVVDGVRERERP